MRKIYALFSVLLFFVHYKGQETLPYYQQYLLDGDFLYNPALYGKTDDVVLNLNYVFPRPERSGFLERDWRRSVLFHPY